MYEGTHKNGGETHCGKFIALAPCIGFLLQNNQSYNSIDTVGGN